MNAAVIGGGLAGCSVAWRLQASGVEVTLYEQNPVLASEASGNFAAMFHPYVEGATESKMSFLMRESWQGFCAGVSTLEKEVSKKLANKTGVVHFPATGRLRKIIKGSESKLNSDEIAELTGVDGNEAFFFPEGGWLDPRRLCAELSREVSRRLQTPVRDIKNDGSKWRVNNRDEFDILVLANASQANLFEPARKLEFSLLKGQVYWYQPSELSRKLEVCVAYDGYITPPIDGLHMVGATFERGKSDMELTEEGADEVFNRLSRWLPGYFDSVAKQGRAGVRAVTYDKIPYIGQLEDNLYVSLGLGSRGVQTCFLAASVIAGLVSGKEPNKEIVKITNPLRRAL